MSEGFTDGSPEYEAWLAARRFRIVRHAGFKAKEVVETGLDCEAARVREKELNAAYCKANPSKTAWSSDLFIRELETPPWKPRKSTARSRIVLTSNPPVG